MSLAIGWRRTLVKLVAAAIVLALYGFARPPRLAGSERAEMAARFRFEPSPLPEHSGPRLSSPGHLRFARLLGERTFAMPASKVLGRDSFKGMGLDFGDLNGDGILDLYVSDLANEFGLQESHLAFVSTGETARRS